MLFLISVFAHEDTTIFITIINIILIYLGYNSQGLK